MNYDDQDAGTLAALLRTQTVRADQVLVGDVVVSDKAVFLVDHIDLRDVPPEMLRYPYWRAATAYIDLCDANGNSTGRPNDAMVTIIARDCLHRRPEPDASEEGA